MMNCFLHFIFRCGILALAGITPVLPQELGDSTYHPLGGPREVTSDFGYRSDPFWGGRANDFHYGVDLQADVGDSVYAWQRGQVIFTGYSKVSGKMIHIQHRAGMVSKYHHLKKILVKKGTLVRGGQLIGLAGKSGRVTGPHLHFSLLQVGKHLDPLPYLKTAKPVIPQIIPKFQPIPVIKHVLVKSYPVNGKLILNGEEIGSTPQELALPYGEHFIEIDAGKDYQPFIARFYVDQLFASLFTARLEKQSSVDSASGEISGKALRNSAGK